MSVYGHSLVFTRPASTQPYTAFCNVADSYKAICHPSSNLKNSSALKTSQWYLVLNLGFVNLIRFEMAWTSWAGT